jgi:hypothetical protein
MTSLIARIFLEGFTLVFRTFHIPDHGYQEENLDDPDCFFFSGEVFTGSQVLFLKFGEFSCRTDNNATFVFIYLIIQWISFAPKYMCNIRHWGTKYIYM